MNFSIRCIPVLITLSLISNVAYGGLLKKCAEALSYLVGRKSEVQLQMISVTNREGSVRNWEAAWKTSEDEIKKFTTARTSSSTVRAAKWVTNQLESKASHQIYGEFGRIQLAILRLTELAEEARKLPAEEALEVEKLLPLTFTEVARYDQLFRQSSISELQEKCQSLGLSPEVVKILVGSSPASLAALDPTELVKAMTDLATLDRLYFDQRYASPPGDFAWYASKEISRIAERLIGEARGRPAEQKRIIATLLFGHSPDSYVDRMLGFESIDLVKREESEARELKEETYRAWPTELFSSSYESFGEYGHALGIHQGGKVIDLGAGTFRAAPYFVLKENVSAVGYEFHEGRVKAGQGIIDSLEIANRAKLIHADLSDPKLEIESADGYILMNPFPEQTSKNIFAKLQKIAAGKKKFRILIYTSAADTLRVARQQNWLVPLAATPSDKATFSYQVFETVN